ncbi:NADH:ubiquinone oxidoreductase subunit 4 [Desulfocucumis palustris]|uniref:NADH:ubiquinone oxidoreductase subunit 4 n=1 Tax=Desulfocucumis palustris TaxID=1898651 RepID=A0A2L2X7U2_9FIRM|nr:NfeD family protein [Desulfocucumis palustris]GBF32168.1 NADH:ubiquinone oxidoreductase subunit 4 [Desulfocucumis palustris]
MYAIYWGCLIGGSLFALTTIIFGDVLGDILDGVMDSLPFEQLAFMQPMVIVGGVAVFGGAGILLDRYTSLDILPVFLAASMAGVLSSAVTYFAYVKPMKNTENSTGFSIQDLVGKIGEVIVPVPAQGFGEVVVRAGAGNTNQIAASLDGEELAAGARVVVGDVREGVLYVFRYDE